MKTLPIKAFKLSCVALSAALVLISCSPNREEKYMSESSPVKYADSVSGLITTNAPDILKHDTAHAFIRKADIRFKVKDVKHSTFQVEDIVKNHHGYVTYTNLKSSLSSKNSVRLSADTVIDITNYQVENDITIRVPNEELDATLKEIATLIDFLDYRKITANDVKFQLLSNRLSEARFQKHKKRVESAIDTQGKKLPQTTDAENELTAKQETADDTKIQTMELLDEVNYSTVTLNIYQPETQKTERYAYMAPVKPYEPGFGAKLLDSVCDGGKIFGEFIVFMIRLWPLVIIAIGLVILIKWIIKQKWVGQ